MPRPITLILGASMALSACAQSGAPSHDEKSNVGLSFEEQIDRNWLIPQPLQCRQVVQMRIRFASDGKVTGTEPLDPMEAGDACLRVAESIRRAALISSPFWFPSGQTPASTVLRFDPEKFKAFY